MINSITLAYPPSANQYWKLWNNRIVVSNEARAYKTLVAILGRGKKKLDGDIEVSIDVYRPAKRGDLDNSIKITLDALCKVLYNDDSQIVKIVARRFDDKKNPRIEVRVENAQEKN